MRNGMRLRRGIRAYKTAEARHNHTIVTTKQFCNLVRNEQLPLIVLVVFHEVNVEKLI